MTIVLLFWLLGTAALAANILIRRYPTGMVIVTPLWVLIPFALLVTTVLRKKDK